MKYIFYLIIRYIIFYFYYNTNISMAKASYKFKLRNLCTPAGVYFLISVVSLVLVVIQNMTNGSDDNTLCVGTKVCSVGSKAVVFTLNAVYILFWTFILDMMCKSGYRKLSWFILLLPFILVLTLMAVVMVDEVAEDVSLKKKSD